MPVIILDTNALIDYVRERALRERGYLPTSPAAGMLRRRLGPLIGDRIVHAPRTVYNEAFARLQKDLEDKLDGPTYARVRDHAYDLLTRTLAGIFVPDAADHVEDARAMYAAIADDPASPKLAEWRLIKGRRRTGQRPSPGRGDLAILSTAARYAQSGSAELWTHDADLPCLRTRSATGSAWRSSTPAASTSGSCSAGGPAPAFPRRPRSTSLPPATYMHRLRRRAGAMSSGPGDIGDALAGAISGEVVRGGDEAAMFYAADAGPFDARPAAAAVPRDEDDVAAAVRLAAERGVPVTARGGGTGLAGGAVGSGIILDMRLLAGVEIDGEGGGEGGDPPSLTAGAGAPKGAIDDALGARGLFLGPNPSVGPYCTAGGMVATNAAGSRSLKYGATIDNLLGARIVDGRGRIADLPADADLSARIASAAAAGGASASAGFPAVEKNSCGYRIDAVGGPADSHRIFAGSEGTLGIVVSARLRAFEAPASRRLYAVACASPADAAADCLRLRAAYPSAIEYIDGRILAGMGGGGGSGGRAIEMPDWAACALLAEFDGPAPRGPAAPPPPEAALMRRLRGAVACSTSDAAEMRRWWRLRDAALSETLRGGRGGGGRAPLPSPPPAYVVEDAAVPPERVGELLALVSSLEARFGLRAAVYGHIGSGNLHVRLSGGDGDDFGGVGDRWPGGRPRMRRIAEWYFGRVVAMGGTITGEHGDGLARTWYVARQYGAPALRSFAALKALLDPRGILNPGKIVPAPPRTSTRRTGRSTGA